MLEREQLLGPEADPLRGCFWATSSHTRPTATGRHAPVIDVIGRAQCGRSPLPPNWTSSPRESR
jgi:hypothetical protein